jgi:hypothetical protein
LTLCMFLSQLQVIPPMRTGVVSDTKIQSHERNYEKILCKFLSPVSATIGIAIRWQLCLDTWT